MQHMKRDALPMQSQKCEMLIPRSMLAVAKALCKIDTIAKSLVVDVKSIKRAVVLTVWILMVEL